MAHLRQTEKSSVPQRELGCPKEPSQAQKQTHPTLSFMTALGQEQGDQNIPHPSVTSMCSHPGDQLSVFLTLWEGIHMSKDLLCGS